MIFTYAGRSKLVLFLMFGENDFKFFDDNDAKMITKVSTHYNKINFSNSYSNVGCNKNRIRVQNETK